MRPELEVSVSLLLLLLPIYPHPLKPTGQDELPDSEHKIKAPHVAQLVE